MEEDTRELIRQIAKQHLRIESLEMRGRDQLDVHSLSVASIDRALLAAFNAGTMHAQDADQQDAEMRHVLDRLEHLYVNELRVWHVATELHIHTDVTHLMRVETTGYDAGGNEMKIIISRHLPPQIAELIVLSHNNLGKLIRLARLGLEK